MALQKLYQRTSILLFIFLFTFHANLNSSVSTAGTFTGPIEDFLKYNEIISEGSVFEWKIQNVQKSTDYDFINLNNNDILTIEVMNLFNGSMEFDYDSLIFLPTSEPRYILSLNNQVANESTQVPFLLSSGITFSSPDFYQLLFDFKIYYDVNVYEPIYFYPLVYINGSDTISYFDKFYNVLSEKANQIDYTSVKMSSDKKYIEIKYYREFIQLENKITNDIRLVINTEIGILGFFRYFYENINLEDETKNDHLSYEIISEAYGPKKYRTGDSYWNFIIIASTTIICLTNLSKKKRNT